MGDTPSITSSQVGSITINKPPGELVTSCRRLSSTLENLRGKNHLIIIQGVPDPDAISSALALQLICSLYDINSNILTFNSLSHHENRALVKQLGITLQRYNADFDLAPFDIYSLVDSQKFVTPIDNRLLENNIAFFAFVDHHREDLLLPPAMFVDIRSNVASTAAIFCEYLKEFFPGGLSPSDESHINIATALMHGIRSDTSKFLTASKMDFAAAAYLANCVDSKVLDVIERKVLTSFMLEMFERALVNRRIHDNFLFSDVGYVRSSDRDGIPQVADFLLSRESTDTVLIFGIVDEKTIDGSLRTRSETINPDEFIKGFLGISPESGRYYGGGNIRDRGAFQIPLGFFSLYEDKNQVYNIARQVLEKSFLEYIGKATEEVLNS